MKNNWDIFYEKHKEIDFESEDSIIRLVDRLKCEGVIDILDAGCETGRNSRYLLQKGFNVHAFDISVEAINLAKQYDDSIDYRVATIANSQFPTSSMKFVFALHLLEYGSWQDICSGVENITRILKKIDQRILLLIRQNIHFIVHLM